MRRHFFPILCVLVVLLLTALPTAHAEETAPLPLPRAYRFTHLTTEDGLPSNQVTSIFQDSHGFVWIGTSAGLARYDGGGMRVFYRSPDDSASLATDNIQHIFEDRAGNVWVMGRQGGAGRYLAETGDFAYLSQLFPDNPFIAGEFFTGMEESRGILWFGGHPRVGFLGYDPVSGALQRFDRASNQTDGYNAQEIWAIREDEAGDLWLAGGTVLVRYVAAEKRFESYTPTSGNLQRLDALVADGRGGWWLGSQNGLSHFDPATGIFTPYPGSTEVISLLLDQRGILWVGSAVQGVQLFDPATHSFVATILHDPTDPHSLLSDKVTTLAEDATGVVWVGTEGGVSLFDPTQWPFARYSQNPDDPRSLPGRVVHGISGAVRGESVWIGSGSFLTRVDKQTGVAKHFPVPGNAEPPTPDIGTVYQDRTGAVWVGVRNRDFYRFDPASETFLPFALPDFRALQGQSPGPGTEPGSSANPPPPGADRPPDGPPGGPSDGPGQELPLRACLEIK